MSKERKVLTPENYIAVIKRLLKDQDSCNMDEQEWYGEESGEFKEVLVEAGYGHIFEE